MTNQRFFLKKIKALSAGTAGSLLPSDVALPDCQSEQVGFTVPLNSGQAEVAVPQAAEGSPACGHSCLSPWDPEIIPKPFPDFG